MSEAKKAGATLESIKVIPFSGTDTTKGNGTPRIFHESRGLRRHERFQASTFGGSRVAEPGDEGRRTDEEEELIRQDDEAKHFLIMSCRGDAFAIIESHETAFAMYQALKDRYDSKKTRDLVKATTKLEKCYMKSDLDDPHLWIMEMERLNREVEKCENGTRRSDEQMEATILARLPKRRYESVIASLNGKIGSKDFTHKDFVSEILVHYQMFVEPFKNRQARENQGREKERQAPGAQHIKRKRRLACVQGQVQQVWKARPSCKRMPNEQQQQQQRRTRKRKIEGQVLQLWSFGHIAKECPKKEESGMFVGMTIRGAESREDDVKRNVESTKDYYFDTDKFAMELLQEIAEYNNTKRAVLKDIREFKWKPRGDEQAKVKIRREKKKPSTMSWADMCETSDDEDDEDKVEEKIEDVAEDDLEYDESKAQEPEAGEEVIDHKEDKMHYEESKTGESEAERKVENTESITEAQEEFEYRMDKSSQGAEWMWDEQVFATNSRKFMSPVTESGHESWLVDSGATTHVSINTKMMTNLKTATEGEHVRVGNNETMKAIAIGDLTLEQKSSGKKLKLEDVMVVPGFAKNLISVGRLTEKGNEFVAGKEGSKIFNESREMLEFETGSDGMAYLIASRIKGERKAFNVEEIAEKDEEMEKKERKQYMDINEAHQKFGHATERVVRETLKALEIIATGKMSVCDGCARAKATQKENKQNY
ncbi:Reverse transcriptase (RNA-dependent DNA polymerase) [Fragilaria crotonensis]|nr:Reverse transcriptase (RNA-dependent DNA polymerase) [Fragilaria crotonensis]